MRSEPYRRGVDPRWARLVGVPTVDRELVTGAGLDVGAVEALVGRARREVDAGLLPACQVALARNGEVVLDATFGDAVPTDRFVVFSCTKAITAAAIWRLLSDGRLSTDQRVAEVIPEFGSHGKDVVTVEQLLTHTAGFPSARLGPPEWGNSSSRLERIRDWRLEWEPGTRFEYHPTSANWVLAELISAVAGVDHRTFMRRELLEPMGLRSTLFGADPLANPPPSVAARPVQIVGDPPTSAELEELGDMGRQLAELVERVSYDERVIYGEPDTIRIGAPAGGVVSTAADMARFYQAVMNDNGELFDPDVLRSAIGEIACDLPDGQRGCPAHRGLGIVIAGDDGFAPMRGFGASVSAEAFGHDGAGGQIAFGDPASGLSMTYLTDGQDLNLMREWGRSNAVATLAGRCVSS